MVVSHRNLVFDDVGYHIGIYYDEPNPYGFDSSLYRKGFIGFK